MTGGTRGRARPGIPEIVVGLAVFAVVGYGSPPLLKLLELDPVIDGIAVGAVSGVAGILGFGGALAMRVRSLRPFGVRSTTPRWILLGLAGGVVAFVISRIGGVLYVLAFGQPENVQAVYNTAAQGGVLALIVSSLALAVLTPIGEELLFRGVVTSALLRWGPVVGVVGSALVFAVMHLNVAVAITAFVVGLIAAELRRRSDSIWPAVVVRVVNNLGANLIGAFAT